MLILWRHILSAPDGTAITCRAVLINNTYFAEQLTGDLFGRRRQCATEAEAIVVARTWANDVLLRDQ